jgi:hypothetical protein
VSDANGGPTIPGVVDLVQVGRGGFGVVYRGYQPELGRNVAVKLISTPGTPEEAVERWRREVSAMGRLSNHPNIVSVYAGGVTDDGSPYLVMPYIPDGTLGDRLRRDGAMAPEAVAALGAKLAGALASAHHAGVLHRDIKPDNVLLSPYGEPQLTDFGIARLVDATATLTRSIQASLPYAAPEVLMGHPATAAADVYGLGATLHACLAGEAPFPTRGEEALVAFVGRIAHEPAPDLRASGVPAPLADVVARALAKTPEERIRSADALQQELEAAGRALAAGGAAAGETTVVRPTGGTVLLPTEGAAPDAGAAGATPPGAVRRTPAAVPPRGRTNRAAVAVAGVVIAVLVAALVALLLDGDGDGSDGDDVVTAPGGAATSVPATTPTTAAEVTTSTTPTTAPTTTTTTAATTTTASTTTTTTTTTTTVPASGEAAPAIARTATGYFEALAEGDLRAAYGMLSPGLRAAQSRDSYESFWGERDVSVVGDPIVDAAGRTARVPIEIDGRRQDFTLRLVPGEGGSWLVDGPRPR